MSLLPSALSRLRLCAPPMQARWKGGPGGVQRQTRLTVIDNSGAKKLKVIDYAKKYEHPRLVVLLEEEEEARAKARESGAA